MISETNAPATSWAALKRRKVVQWAIAYAAGGWIVLQVLSLLAGVYAWPPIVLRIGTGAVFVGFPVALVLAWYHGERGEQRISGTELLIVSLLLALGGGALWRIEHNEAATPTAAAARAMASLPAAAVPASAKSIAVLPFADLSRARDQEYFSDGMAEELLNALAKVKDLKVAGRTSSFQFKGKNVDMRAIGHELGVANILEGSVRKQGDKVRITAQLIQTEDGFHLWSESYDGELSDVFALQERIARAITDQLKVILQGDQQQQLVRAGTGNAEAYALFLKATDLYNRRDFEHLGEAVDALEQALQLDPKFARARARLAATHVVWENRDAPFRELAETNARAALALDPQLPEPWAVLGRSYGNQRRFLDAFDAYQHALQLDPDDALTNYWYAVLQIMTGYTREGRARLDRALVLDPMQPNAELWRGLELSYAGDQEAAQRSVQRAADIGLSFAVYGFAEVAFARGNYAQANELLLPRVTRGFAKCGINADDAKRAMAGVHGGDAAARTIAVEVTERCLADSPEPTQFWALKSLMYLDQPARMLAFAQPRLTNNETFLFEMLWSPYGKSARRLPEFAGFARKTGLTAVWDKFGPPDSCRSDAATGDYLCQ